jgi:hypothetical protein
MWQEENQENSHLLVLKKLFFRKWKIKMVTLLSLNKWRRHEVQSVLKERRYIKSPVELCGSIILLCWTMSSRCSRQMSNY